MKPFLFLTLLSLLTSHLKAQNHILWEVNRNDLSQPSYVMGVLKFTGEQEYYLPPEATQKLQMCSIFSIEDKVDHRAQHELNKALHFPKGQSLRTVLSSDEYNKLTLFFEGEFGMPAKKFEKKFGHITPLPLSIIMTRLSLAENVKYYDIQLLLLAKRSRLATYSLEEIEREAEAINSFSLEDQVAALMHSVENFDIQKEEFRKLLEEFPDGDVERIYEYTLHPFERNETFIQEFYTKRNHEWLPKIEGMMHEAPTFSVLGLSHLEGEDGIINLLRANGYTLTPVTITARD